VEPDFTSGKGAPGRAQLYVDRDLVAQTDVPVTTPVCFNPGSLSCGANPGSPVVPDYQPPFRFTGVLHSVTVDLGGDLITDSESEMRLAMSRQ
jgi:arylsulfatase